MQEMFQEACWMSKYIRRYRWTIAVHILLGVCSILMGLGTSVASKFLIDSVTGYHSGKIGAAAAMMIGMLLGSLVLRSVGTYVGARLNIKVHDEIQAEIYKKILATEWQSLEHFKSGDLMSRLTGDVGTVASGVTNFVPSLVSGLVQFFGALGIILYYDPIMAGIALLGVPMAVLGSRVLLNKMRQHSRRMKDISGEVMSFYEDSLTNLTSIKAFDVTRDFNLKMEEHQAKYREEFLTYNLFSLRTSAVISLLGMAISAGCFGWGVYRLWSGIITFGAMTMFLQLVNTLSGSASTLIGMVSSVISISTSAGRVMELTRLPMEETEADRDFRKENNLTIQMKDAGFSYQGGQQVLHEINFTAGPGDLIALTGPSGEGKTTMLRVLLGLVRPQTGVAVLQSGEDAIPLSAATRSAFAYVPQGNSMFAGTIAENLRLTAPDATDAELIAALKIVCAWDFVQQLPGGLQYQVGGRGRGLSEGQAQRLAVARAILRHAPILLLDEATSALDEETEEKMLRNLMSSGKINTCIFVTHRSSTVRFCTRQYHVESGFVSTRQQEAICT